MTDSFQNESTHNLERISNSLTIDSLTTFQNLFLLLFVFIGHFSSYDSTEKTCFQNHLGTKHLYEDFCPVFAGIPSISSRIPTRWDRMRNFLA